MRGNHNEILSIGKHYFDRDSTCLARVMRSLAHATRQRLGYATEQYMGVELDKLGWPYNRLKSLEDLGWLYRNANKPRPPTNQRRLTLCSAGLVVLIQLGGYVPRWAWGASTPWRILGILTVTAATSVLWLWASRRGFFYATDQSPD